MKEQIVQSIKLFLVLTILTGILYPLSITAIAQLFFPHRANGSLITKDGSVIGSELIAQKFQSDRYFWSRPSAIDYNPMPSGASNLGPTSDTLRTLVEQRKNNFIKNNHLTSNTVVPTEMIFASGSGIDPHISHEAAFMQVDRIAQARRFDNQKKTALTNLVRNHLEAPQFGLLGEPRVNVLMLNLALDDLK